jgi:superkiller protein 3
MNKIILFIQMKKSKTESLLKEALNYHQNLDFINARKIYEKIIHEDPLHFDGYKLLATLEAQNNNISLASSLFLKAYKINPKDKSLLNNMGGVAQIEKKYDSAINYLNQALAIDPLYYDALYNLGSVYQDLNKNSDALAIYEKAIQINKTDFRSFNNLGIVLINLASHEKALENFQKALNLQPENADIFNNIGKLYLIQE